METNTIDLHLGYTSTLPLKYEDPLKQQLLKIFRSNVRINIGRLGKDVFSIEIEHLDVQSARYDTFNYTERVVGMVGDKLHLRSQRYVVVQEFSNRYDEVTLEFGKLTE